MTGGKRIIAFGPGSETPQPASEAPLELSDNAIVDEDWAESDSEEDFAPAGREWLAPALAIAGLALWTLFFLWAERTDLAAGVTPRQASALIAAWAPPALVIGVAWLLAMRTSRREAHRFGEVARALSVESARLDQRLTRINRELSLAREFIAAQSRDLEALGRIAADRLSDNADRLQALIRDNGAQVEAIAGVSVTALDNMERLRGQLPVLTNSSKDLANAIGHAGRTAQDSLDGLTAGFGRLTEAGTRTSAELDGMHEKVDASLALFDTRIDQIQALVSARIEALEHRGGQLRDRLSADEADALSALERRAKLLHDEFERSRNQLEGHEAEALTSLRARLAALRDEGTALARSLREGESGALEALLAAKTRVEDEITAVVARLDKLDRDALDAASRRVEKLSSEALEFDTRLIERNRLFTEEMEQRLSRSREKHDNEVARLKTLFEQVDGELNARLERQALHQQDLARHGEAVCTRLESLSDRIAAVAAFGNQADEALGRGLATLNQRMAVSRDALAGTGSTIEQLTDGAVRLLELLQASVQQSREDLPAALAEGHKSLSDWEERVAELRSAVGKAEAQGDALARSASETRATLASTLEEIDQLHAGLSHKAGDYGATLAEIRASLADIGSDSDALAERASTQLTAAIGSLEAAARAAAARLGTDTADAVSAVAERLGEESAAAIDRALRLRLAEAVGSLEQAASHAAGVSREAAIQLRDQLGKVHELTSNLEKRVAHARQRAEEQVDNDFSRRVALITESLNSYAIDVAKALSTEVTDTAWAAYLRGDRGVFTRRALRLVDAAEQREIARMYEDDQEFRGHVSRYIHDFEAMLRQLLSTRDGHALGVTLLSSDMGKLYVLLAQSIERLRT